MRFEHARQAIHDAYAVHHAGKGLEVPAGVSSLPACRGRNRARATATVTSKGNPWAIANQVEAGKIIAVVEAQPGLVKTWLLYAYAPPRFTSQAAMERLIEHAYGQVYASDGANWAGKAMKTQRVLAHVGLALADLAHSLVTGKPKYTMAEIARETGTPYKNWHRDWEPLYIQLLRSFGALDREGLPAVIRVVVAEREKLELENAA